MERVNDPSPYHSNIYLQRCIGVGVCWQHSPDSHIDAICSLLGMEEMKIGKLPTINHRRYWARVAKLGCIIGSSQCSGRITIHHCGTGAGGRKNHNKVIPLCWEHHLGANGIDGKRMSKREWQQRYGSEEELLNLTRKRLENEDA